MKYRRPLEDLEVVSDRGDDGGIHRIIGWLQLSPEPSRGSAARQRRLREAVFEERRLEGAVVTCHLAARSWFRSCIPGVES